MVKSYFVTELKQVTCPVIQRTDQGRLDKLLKQVQATVPNKSLTSRTLSAICKHKNHGLFCETAPRVKWCGEIKWRTANGFGLLMGKVSVPCRTNVFLFWL